MSLITDLNASLKIKKSSCESNELYHARIIYSALSQVLRVASLDITNENGGVSKKHLLTRGKEFLDICLDENKDIVDWFFEDEKIHPVKKVREELLYARDLINEDGKLFLRQNDNKAQIHHFVRIVDPFFSQNYNDYCVMGNGIYVGKEYDQDEGKQFLNVNEVYEKFISQAKFKSEIPRGDIQYFDCRLFTNTLYKCWVDSLGDTSKSVIRKNNIDGYSYYLTDGHMCISIPDWYTRNHGYRRIMYLLRNKNENPVKVRFKICGEYVRLALCSKLPDYELHLFRMLGWPVNNINDELNWLFLIDVWEKVVEILEHMGIKMEEVYGEI